MCVWTSRVIGCLAAVFCLFSAPALSQFSPEDQHFIYPEFSKRISMDFKDAALTDIFKIFSKQSGENYVVSQEVGQRRTSLFLDNVPVQEALEQIVSANDLEYDIKPGSNIFSVRAKVKAKDAVITRFYRLRHASVSSSKINSTINIGKTSSISSEGGSGGGSATGSTASSGASSTSGSVGGITEAIKAVLSPSGKLAENARTNSLIITDVTSQFPVIEQTLYTLDVPIPQILIEVEMLDISKATSDLMGAKWGGSIFEFTGASKNSLLPFDQTAFLAKPGTSLATGDDEDKAVYFIKEGGNLDFSHMQVLVNFLRTRTDTRNLAKPRILTLNNETAEIKVSTDEVIGVTTVSTGGDGLSQTTVQAERAQTGVFLTVTPQANLVTREIMMALYPKVIQARRGGTFGGVTYNNPEERGAQSILRIRDGQTIIIGGLFRRDDQNTVTKIPFLGDIPLLGQAFRHKDQQGTDRELIIFLTPHILQDQDMSILSRDGYIGKNDTREDVSRDSVVQKALVNVEKKRD